MIANVENARIGAIDILVNNAAAYMAKAFQQLSNECHPTHTIILTYDAREKYWEDH
ncbi:hypothetical protein [Shouchella patagoniensis]|uniref:hypothetical protein n=1 Tax=Shouchella patagoniensis TaxID=228576 RepID=UPI0014751FB1|nr:hypothetical protein [Shouchella patagoniensis]